MRARDSTTRRPSPVRGGPATGLPRQPGLHFRLGRVHLARARAGLEADAAGTPGQRPRRVQAGAGDRSDECQRRLRGRGDSPSGGQARRGADILRAAVSHYPEFEEALVGLGRVLVALGTPAAAVPLLAEGDDTRPARCRGRLLPAVAGASRARQRRGAAESAGRVPAAARRTVAGARTDCPLLLPRSRSRSSNPKPRFRSRH